VIESFADKETRKIFDGEHSKKFPADLQDRAERKLIQIHESTSINQLKIPAGNRLEPLTGDLKGYHSIRINQQWRIIFQWENGNARNVGITDYH
jgi:proteic killer suppression protein